jgi:hypothetical protein
VKAPDDMTYFNFEDDDKKFINYMNELEKMRWTPQFVEPGGKNTRY